ncbi:hypothetical protein [Neorhodopirellula lusitana]
MIDGTDWRAVSVRIDCSGALANFALAGDAMRDVSTKPGDNG